MIESEILIGWPQLQNDPFTLDAATESRNKPPKHAVEPGQSSFPLLHDRLLIFTPFALGSVPFFKETIWDDWSQKYTPKTSSLWG